MCSVIFGKINLFLNKLNSAAKIIILIMMIIMVPVVIANVLLRFLFGKSIIYSTELSKYAFVWVTFLGAAIALKEGSHAKVEFILDGFLKKIKKFLKLLNYLIIIGLSIIFIIVGIEQVIATLNICSPYMRFLPLGYVYLVIPISGFLILLFSFGHILELFKKEKVD